MKNMEFESGFKLPGDIEISFRVCGTAYCAGIKVSNTGERDYAQQRIQKNVRYIFTLAVLNSRTGFALETQVLVMRAVYPVNGVKIIIGFIPFKMGRETLYKKSAATRSILFENKSLTCENLFSKFSADIISFLFASKFKAAD